MLESFDEQYRKAALALAAGLRAGGFRSIFFASATRREGTTSTVLQIARQLKDFCDMEPLVVEFNRSSPALVRMFDLDLTRSVAAIAAGARAPGDCVQMCPGGLALLPAGEFSASTSGLNLEAVVQKIQHDLEPIYKAILWDAPPILEHSDAFVLARVIPRMVLVVESGKARHEVVKRIQNDLESSNVEILGSVLVKQKKLIPEWIYRFLVQ